MLVLTGGGCEGISLTRFGSKIRVRMGNRAGVVDTYSTFEVGEADIDVIAEERDGKWYGFVLGRFVRREGKWQYDPTARIDRHPSAPWLDGFTTQEEALKAAWK